MQEETEEDHIEDKKRDGMTISFFYALDFNAFGYIIIVSISEESYYRKFQFPL